MSALILRWVLQSQMCSVLLHPYFQQHLFSKFQVYFCAPQNLFTEVRQDLFFLPLSPCCSNWYSPVTFLWLLRSVSSTWVVQGQWQHPPTASYRDIWWSWALDLRPEDYFLEGWGKNYDVKSRGKLGNDVSCKKKRKHSNDLEKKILNICSFLVGHHN